MYFERGTLNARYYQMGVYVRETKEKKQDFDQEYSLDYPPSKLSFATTKRKQCMVN